MRSLMAFGSVIPASWQACTAPVMTLSNLSASVLSRRPWPSWTSAATKVASTIGIGQTFQFHLPRSVLATDSFIVPPFIVGDIRQCLACVCIIIGVFVRPDDSLIARANTNFHLILRHGAGGRETRGDARTY